MTVRPLKPSDIPILQEFAERSGFPYPDLSDPLIESVQVAVDSQDRPIMAVVAKRLIETYLYVDPDKSPAVKMDALKALHRGMATALRNIGYTECNVQIPPVIAKAFGRRLGRSFGWARNTWDNWFIRF